MTNRASDFHGQLCNAIPSHEQGYREYFAQVPVNNFENEGYVRFQTNFPMSNVLDYSCYKEDEEPVIKKKRWKKPAGKPKRPQSAYNLFFQLERARLLNNEAERKYTKEEVDRIADQQKERSKQPLVKRKHRKTHGKIGFGDLARTIANTWKAMDAADKIVFEERAAIEKQEYVEAVEKWNTKQCHERKIEGEENFIQHSKSHHIPPPETINQRKTGYGSKINQFVHHADLRYRRDAWPEREQTFLVDNDPESNGYRAYFENDSRTSTLRTESIQFNHADNVTYGRAEFPQRHEARDISFSYMRRRLPYKFYFGSRGEERADSLPGHNSQELDQVPNSVSYEFDIQTVPLGQRSRSNRTYQQATNYSNETCPPRTHHNFPGASFTSNRNAVMQLQPQSVDMLRPSEHLLQQRSGASKIGSTRRNESVVTMIEGPETPEEEFQMSVLLKSFDRGDI
jgi:hypothetical protein